MFHDRSVKEMKAMKAAQLKENDMYKTIYDDWAESIYDEDGMDVHWMLLRIRTSLKARLEGRNEGGDTEVMRLVDEIVKKEAILHMPGIF